LLKLQGDESDYRYVPVSVPSSPRDKTRRRPMNAFFGPSSPAIRGGRDCIISDSRVLRIRTDECRCRRYPEGRCLRRTRRSVCHCRTCCQYRRIRSHVAAQCRSGFGMRALGEHSGCSQRRPRPWPAGRIHRGRVTDVAHVTEGSMAASIMNLMTLMGMGMNSRIELAAASRSLVTMAWAG
jgi:hypothetical protein